MNKKTTVPNKVVDTIYYHSDKCLERIKEIVQRQTKQEQRQKKIMLEQLEKQATTIKRISENLREVR